MINILNKLLARFGFQVVKSSIVIPQEKTSKQNSFIDDITTPEFAQKHPEFLNRYLSAKKHSSLYVGDINYIKDSKGRVYFKDLNNKYYCDYDMKNPSN